jgi:hypothetical protein
VGRASPIGWSVDGSDPSRLTPDACSALFFDARRRSRARRFAQ